MAHLFVFCYVIFWSQALVFPNLYFLVNYLTFPLGIEMLFCAPSQGAWWLLAVTVHEVAEEMLLWPPGSFKPAAEDCDRLPRGHWCGVWLANCIAGTSLAPVPHPSWDPALLWSLALFSCSQPWSFACYSCWDWLNAVLYSAKALIKTGGFLASWLLLLSVAPINTNGNHTLAAAAQHPLCCALLSDRSGIVEVIPSASHRGFTARGLAVTSYVPCQLNVLLFSFLGRAWGVWWGLMLVLRHQE